MKRCSYKYQTMSTTWAADNVRFDKEDNNRHLCLGWYNIALAAQVRRPSKVKIPKP